MRFYSRFLNCLHDDAYCDGRDPACFHCYRHRVNAALIHLQTGQLLLPSTSQDPPPPPPPSPDE